MSEEEIIKDLKKIIDSDNCWLEDEESADEDMIEWAKLEKSAIQGLLDLYQKEKQKNTKAIEMLQEHIKHCEQEAKGSLNNKICHIALKFDKHLLKELLEERNK